MPQVSVLMAVYNGLPYLSQAIDSILAQTMPDFEFIIINDASSDDTQKVIEDYSDPRICLVNLVKNGGQTAALNHGLRLATAPFIARQDSDDRSKPERLEKQLAFLEAYPDYWLVGTAADLIDDRNRILYVSEHPTTDESIRQTFAAHDNPFYHGSVMFRREVLDRIGYYREGFRNSQDYDYWLRIAEQGKVANLPAPSLYQYRLHEGQMTFTSYYRMKAEWKLAEKLAAIRAEQGDDADSYEQEVRQLETYFATFTPTPRQKRRAMAELWRGKGVSHLRSGNRLPMLYCLLRAFLYEPDNPDFWRGVRNHLPI
jgi:glycosyltransferase involved in cell wall biosynthesis